MGRGDSFHRPGGRGSYAQPTMRWQISVSYHDRPAGRKYLFDVQVVMMHGKFVSATTKRRQAKSSHGPQVPCSQGAAREAASATTRAPGAIQPLGSREGSK